MNAQNFFIPFIPMPNKRIAKIIRLFISYALLLIFGQLLMYTGAHSSQLTTILKPKPCLLASVNFTGLWHL